MRKNVECSEPQCRCTTFFLSYHFSLWGSCGIQAISVIRNARLWYSKASLIAQRFLVVLNCFSQNILYFCDMLKRDTASKIKDRELDEGNRTCLDYQCGGSLIADLLQWSFINTRSRLTPVAS